MSTQWLIASDRFSQMVNKIMNSSGGPSGPFIDGRKLAGLLGEGLSQVLSGPNGYIVPEVAHVDKYAVTGRSVSGTNLLDFLENHMSPVLRADWDKFGKYLFWVFVSTTSHTTLGDPQRFDTVNDLQTYIRASAPQLGGFYTESVYFFAYDMVDTADLYPQIRRVRNSMFASLRGRGRWAVKSTPEASGIDSKLSPGYFYNDAGEIDADIFPGSGTAVTWYNKMATNLVRQWTGDADIPATNNDGAVWSTWRKSTRWNFPKVSNSVFVNIGGRVAAWDRGTLNWNTPAPSNSYQIQAPILLYDQGDMGTLRTMQVSSLIGGAHIFGGVSCLVFPLVDGNNLAFALYPNGADTWITEYLDPSLYEMTVRSVFRHQFQPQYRVVPPKQHNGTAETLWKIWKADKSGVSQLWERLPTVRTWGNIDTDKFPIGFDMARRDKITGFRSSWRKLFKVKRRIPYGTLRIDPDFM